MSKKTIYFKKTHKLFISSIVLHNSFHFHYSSNLFADAENILSTTVIQPNKNIDIVTIDVLENGKENIDSQVTLLLYVVDESVKHLRAKVQFDLSREKIMSPNSSEVFKKTIKEGGGLIEGFIQYKFVSMATEEIDQLSYRQHQEKKNQVIISERSMEMSQEYKRMLEIIDEKDSVIKVMEDHIDKMNKEAKKMTINLRDQSMSKDSKSPISLNINLKPSNKIQLQHRKLTKENQSLKARMFKMSQIIQKLRDEKFTSEKEVQTMKELASLQKSFTSNSKQKVSDQKEEKPSIIQRLQAQQSKSDGALESRWLKSNIISSYSEVHRKLNNEDFQLKLEIQNANRFEDISANKDIILTKLKGSVVEIQLLQKEVEELRFYIKKLTDELKILRKNNSKEGIMAKIDAIRSENEKTIEELKSQGNLTLQTQFFTYQKQKWLIQTQLLKKQKEDLQILYNNISSQQKIQEKQFQTRLHKLQIREIELSKERDIYKGQLDQAKTNLEGMLKKDVPYNSIGMATSELAKSYVSLFKEKDQINQKLSAETAYLNEAKEKNNKAREELKLRSSQVEQLKKNQSINKMLNKKLDQSRRQVQKYQKKYEQLRNYVKTIEFTLRSKGKYESQEKYEQQMIKKLKYFQEMTLKAEEELLTQQIQNHKKEKDNIIENFYSSVAQMKKQIDNDSSLSAEEKRVLKEKREEELKKVKNGQLEEIQKKLNEAQSKENQYKQTLIQKMKSVPERLASLEKVLMTSDAKKKQKKLKESVDLKSSAPGPNLVDSIIVRDNSNSIQQLKESLQGQTMKGSDALMKASSTMQELRTKYLQEWTKMNETTRKQMKQTLEDNNKLRLSITEMAGKMQRQRIQKERQINTLMRQWKQKEGRYQLGNMSNTKQKASLQKKIEALTSESSNLKEVIKQNQSSINALQKELTNTNQELNSKIMQNGELQTRNKTLLDELAQYERAAKRLIEQIQRLNDINNENKNEFDRLLQERSNAFVHIESIRKTEIQKLTRHKEELQYRIQRQINDSIKVKGQNSQLFNQNNELLSLNKQHQQNLQLLKETNQKTITELSEKLKMYEDINLELEKNLMTLAEEYNQIQERNVTLDIEKQAAKKELQTYRHLENQLKDIQNKYKNDKNQLQYVIIDKKEQLKKMETDYFIFQEKVKMVSEDNDRMRGEVQKKQQIVESLREKMNDKSLEVIKIAEQKSIAIIEKAQISKEIETLHKDISKMNEELSNLRQENLDLRERLRLSDGERQIEAQSPSESQTPVNQSRLKPDQMTAPAQISRTLSSKIFKSQQNSPPPEENLIQRNYPNPEGKRQIESGVNIMNINDLSDGEDARSEKSRVSRISRVSRRSAKCPKKYQKLDNFYVTQSPPEMFEKKSLSYDREVQLMKQISELYTEKNQLLKQIEELSIEIQELKIKTNHPGSKPQQKQEKKKIIKIDDFSIEENTLEGTISQDNNKIIEESGHLNRTVKSYETDYSQQMKNLELMVEDLEKDKTLLNQALEEEKENNQKLLKMEDQINKMHQEYSQRIDEMNREFQQKNQDFEAAKHEYEEKIQSILSELMTKDEKLAQTLQELDSAHERICLLEQELSNSEVESQEKERALEVYQDKINKMKIEYRKYEEEAELQILTLKQKFEEVVSFNKEKDNQLIEMGQKYLNLEEGAQHQSIQMKKMQLQLQSSEKMNMRLQQSSQKVIEEREGFEVARKKLLKKIHELEVQLVGKHQEIGQANKNASLATAKYSIKIQNMEIQLKDMKRRQEEKDRVVTTLKNEIAHYNQECLVLKQSNQDLDYQLQKVTKELQDIIVHYETEFEELNKQKLSFSQTLKNSDFLLRQKQKMFINLRGELRQSQRQRIKAESELKQIKNTYEHYRLTKQKQFNDKCNDFEFKNNEYELMKTAYEKIVEQNFINETKIEQEKEKYKLLFTDYKVKMASYQEALEDLSKQLTTLSNGPSKEQMDQVLFENQLFKTKIKELEDETKNSRVKNSAAENSIQAEFRKYKTNKEALVQNLEAELESYSSKVNQLEEVNFYLKRDSENLKNQMEKLNEDKYQLQEEVNILQDDINELKEEVEFYKAKRRQGLTKLLNSTDG